MHIPSVWQVNARRKVTFRSFLPGFCRGNVTCLDLFFGICFLDRTDRQPILKMKQA